MHIKKTGSGYEYFVNERDKIMEKKRTKKEKKADAILADSMNSLKDEMEIYSYDDDDYEKRRRKQKAKKQKEKKKTRIKIGVLVAEVMVILGLVFTLIMLIMPNSKAWLASTWLGKTILKSALSEESYNKIVDDNFNRDDTGINEGLDTSVLDEYTNIALFGLDARYGDLTSGINSDCNIIVSINKDTGKVKMASIYRDTHVKRINKDGSATYAKFNSAYCNGGAISAVKTLNANFDLNIKDYIAINFDGIGAIVDAVGGIDVTLSKAEAEYINGYIYSYYLEIGEYDKMNTHKITEKAGNYTLDGVQTTAYCRIRYAAFTNPDGTTINNDFGRTARQRYVINQLLNKAKLMGVDACMDLAEEIFESEDKIFITSIPYDDVIELIPIVLELEMGEQKGYPEKYVAYGGSDLIPDNLAQMVVDLHKHLFDVEDYTPSEKVLGINEVLCGKVGISTDYEN